MGWYVVGAIFGVAIVAVLIVLVIIIYNECKYG
jgi:hypothetical protein